MKDRELAFFVDDDPEFLEMISYLVQHPHFEVQTFYSQNGYQVIDEIIRTKPDVLFIDFNLPRANGIQIVSILRSVEALAKVRVYFVTGYPREQILPLLNDIDSGKVLQKGPTLKEDILKILESEAA